MIARAQKKVEMHYFDIRKHTLDYDDVMNVQREKIYGERRRIMQGADLRDTIVGYLREVVEADINIYAPADVSPDEWDLDGLYTSLNQLFPLFLYVQKATNQRHTGQAALPAVSLGEEEDGETGLTVRATDLVRYFPSADPETVPGSRDAGQFRRDELVEILTTLAERSYADKERHFMEVLGEEQGLEEMRDFERRVTLQALDRHWMEHLSNMDYLREGIGWRGYAGIDPLVLYKKEAYDMFQQMLASVQEEVVKVMSFIQIQMEPAQQALPAGVGALLMQGADEDGMGEAGPIEAAHGGPRSERRRVAKSKGRGRR